MRLSPEMEVNIPSVSQTLKGTITLAYYTKPVNQ